jgi:hypothetical protein
MIVKTESAADKLGKAGTSPVETMRSRCVPSVKAKESWRMAFSSTPSVASRVISAPVTGGRQRSWQKMHSTRANVLRETDRQSISEFFLPSVDHRCKIAHLHASQPGGWWPSNRAEHFGECLN